MVERWLSDGWRWLAMVEGLFRRILRGGAGTRGRRAQEGCCTGHTICRRAAIRSSLWRRTSPTTSPPTGSRSMLRRRRRDGHEDLRAAPGPGPDYCRIVEVEVHRARCVRGQAQVVDIPRPACSAPPRERCGKLHAGQAVRIRVRAASDHDPTGAVRERWPAPDLPLKHRTTAPRKRCSDPRRHN